MGHMEKKKAAVQIWPMGHSLPIPGKEAGGVLNTTSLLEYLIIGSLNPFRAIISADEVK